MSIPFYKPYLTGNEFSYIQQIKSFSGNGEFTERCQLWLQNTMQTSRAMLTQSCTAALEMAALLIDIQPLDEIIMPSYTFVSTANAFVLRGGVPVIVDIHPDTLTLNETLIEDAITAKTKAIVPVHYAGVAADMDAIMALADRYPLFVIEDAAQALLATYKKRYLGAIGHLGAYSFHETKNIMSGEGGALLINHPESVATAEMIREKGTNRSQFFRGMVDKYTWQTPGSSYLPSEITAAFLFAQLEAAEFITNQKRLLWHIYHRRLIFLEERGVLQRPFIPSFSEHNGHFYYILLNNLSERQALGLFLKNNAVDTAHHYVPLHLSPAGKKYGKIHAHLSVTENIADRILRLPLYVEMTTEAIDTVITLIEKFFHSKK